MIVELILLTVAIGIAIETPLGPVNLVVIRAALRDGFAGGLIAGSGSIVGNVAFAAVAAFGVRRIGDLIVGYTLPLQIASGTILMMMGIGTYRAHIAEKALKVDFPPRTPLWRKAASAFFLTITNPATFMAEVTMFGTLGSIVDLAAGRSRPWVAMLGVAAGSLLWWLLITTVVTKLRRRLTSETLDKLNHWTGLGIIGFGVALLANVAWRFG